MGLHEIYIEEISRGDLSLEVLLDVTTLVGEELFQFGTEEQKRKWPVPIARGEKIGAFGLAEAEVGSDPAPPGPPLCLMEMNG